MVAANREEFYDRPFQPPAVHPGSPRVMCGTDRRAGGTWLGVNQHGLLAAITNRLQEPIPPDARSRGWLCREALTHRSADEAAAWACGELATHRYGGANLLVADRHAALVVVGTARPEAVRLTPGLHLLANGNLDDPADVRQEYARWLWAQRFPRDGAAFIAAAQTIMTQGPDPSGRRTILVDFGDRGTVSSSLVTLAADPRQSRWLFAPRRPEPEGYHDLSADLQALLAAG